MAWVAGEGIVGMRGQPYGVVETRHLAVVDAPESKCSDALVRTPGADVCWVQTDQTDPVLAPRRVTIEPFCIERFPFPGEGAPYTVDGMTTWDVAQLATLLESGPFGPRRLCTFTEFQVATAGLTNNQRFVYGDHPRKGACPPNKPIGADAACRNTETGVHEYAAVHSHWVRADVDFVAHACDAPPCMAAGNRLLEAGMFVVAGGTGRVQTRQAPLTPHTWHDHGAPAPDGCDEQGWDDQPVICADPDERYMSAALPDDLVAAERAWVKLVEVGRQTGRMTAVLESGLGRQICPP